MTSEPNFKLPVTLFSPRQIDIYLFELDVYLENLREANVRTKAGQPEQAPELKEEITAFLKSYTKNQQTDPALVEQAVIYLRRLKREAPVVHVTFPTFATDTIKRSVVRWFREEISDNILLSFTVDTSILGGLVVRTENGIHDFSFVNRLINNRSKFTEILQDV